MSIRDKALSREDCAREHCAREHTFQTSKLLSSIRVGSQMSKSARHPVLLSVHFSRFDMLTPNRDTYRDNEPLLSRLECSWVDIPVHGSRDLLWLLLLSVCHVLQAHSRKFQGYSREYQQYASC